MIIEKKDLDFREEVCPINLSIAIIARLNWLDSLSKLLDIKLNFLQGVYQVPKEFCNPV